MADTSASGSALARAYATGAAMALGLTATDGTLTPPALAPAAFIFYSARDLTRFNLIDHIPVRTNTRPLTPPSSSDVAFFQRKPRFFVDCCFSYRWSARPLFSTAKLRGAWFFVPGPEHAAHIQPGESHMIHHAAARDSKQMLPPFTPVLCEAERGLLHSARPQVFDMRAVTIALERKSFADQLAAEERELRQALQRTQDVPAVAVVIQPGALLDIVGHYLGLPQPPPPAPHSPAPRKRKAD